MGFCVGKTVSVIICVYTEQRWDDLCLAIASAQHQTYLASEIIVVVDHNVALQDRLAAVVDITLVPNSQTRGLSGARNSGCTLARSEIIAFLDDDAVAEPQWLEALVAAFDDDHIIGTGGAIMPHWATGQPRWFPSEFQWVVGCSYRGMPTTTARIRNPIGGNMALRRAAFDRIGGFRTEIGRVGTVPLGCEETEWCIRASESLPGAAFLYILGARTHHRVPAQRARWGYFLRRCYAEGLSKAAIERFVHTAATLSTEHGYVTRTLPTGIIRVITDVVRKRDIRLLAQVVAIVLGLVATAWGYAQGKLQSAPTTTARTRERVTRA